MTTLSSALRPQVINYYTMCTDRAWASAIRSSSLEYGQTLKFAKPSLCVQIYIVVIHKVNRDYVILYTCCIEKIQI